MVVKRMNEKKSGDKVIFKGIGMLAAFAGHSISRQNDPG